MALDDGTGEVCVLLKLLPDGAAAAGVGSHVTVVGMLKKGPKVMAHKARLR